MFVQQFIKDLDQPDAGRELNSDATIGENIGLAFQEVQRVHPEYKKLDMFEAIWGVFYEEFSAAPTDIVHNFRK